MVKHGGPICSVESTVRVSELIVFDSSRQGKLPIVGVGGIDSGEAAYARLRAGASLLQLYTALVYKGPGLVADIQDELRGLLAADGYTDVSQAVGVDAIKMAPYAATVSPPDA